MKPSAVKLQLLIGTAVLPVAILWPSDYVCACVCAFDIALCLFAVTESSIRHSTNLLAPSLWAVIGYLAFGQMPVLFNLVFDPSAYDAFGAKEPMVWLILAGYRAMLAGIVLRLPQAGTLRRGCVPNVPLPYSAGFILLGLAARLLIRNNIVDSGAELAWYHTFVFVCTPLGIGLLLANLGQRRDVPWTARLLLTVAATTAIMDVSRKDTGVALLAIGLFIVFKVVPQYPMLKLTASRLLLLGVCLVLFWVVLMGTRAYSWSRVNKTELSEEFRVSLQRRRANDTTQLMTFVVSSVPERYPYLYGFTLGSVLPVPRVVWPARPPAHSYIVGLQFQGLADLSYDPRRIGRNQFSLSAHMLGEGYANFGWLGALAFEWIFGALIGLYERRLMAGQLVVLRILYPLILFFILTQQRGDLAMMNTTWLVCSGMLWVFLTALRAAGRLGCTSAAGLPWSAGARTPNRLRMCVIPRAEEPQQMSAGRWTK